MRFVDDGAGCGKRRVSRQAPSQSAAGKLPSGVATLGTALGGFACVSVRWRWGGRWSMGGYHDGLVSRSWWWVGTMLAAGGLVPGLVPGVVSSGALAPLL
jgi:hypothetical protein